MILTDRSHNEETYKKYIFGSRGCRFNVPHIFTNANKDELNTESLLKDLAQYFKRQIARHK